MRSCKTDRRRRSRCTQSEPRLLRPKTLRPEAKKEKLSRPGSSLTGEKNVRTEFLSSALYLLVRRWLARRLYTLKARNPPPEAYRRDEKKLGCPISRVLCEKVCPELAEGWAAM